MKRNILAIAISFVLLCCLALQPAVYSDNCTDCDDGPPSDPCSWPMYRHDLCNSASVDISCAPDCTYHNLCEKWRFVLPIGEEINSPPSIDKQKAFFGTCKGTFYCLDAINGSLLWSAQVNGGIYNSPAIWKNHVYIGTDSGWFYSFSILGNLEYAQYTASPIRCSPKVFTTTNPFTNLKSDYVTYGDDGGNLWVLTAIGLAYVPTWGPGSKFTTSPTDKIRSSPLIVNNTIYFYCQNYNVYSINAVFGSLNWALPISAIPTKLPDDEVTCTYRTNNGNKYIIISTTSGLLYINDTFATPFVQEIVNNWNVSWFGIITKTNPATNNSYVFDGFYDEYGIDAMLHIKPYPIGINPLSIFNGLTNLNLDMANSSPSVTSNNDVFFTSKDNKLYWMNGSPGINYYRFKDITTPYPKEILTSVAIAYKNIYFASTSCTVYCYTCICNNDIQPPGNGGSGSGGGQIPPPPVPPACPGCPLSMK